MESESITCTTPKECERPRHQNQTFAKLLAEPNQSVGNNLKLMDSSETSQKQGNESTGVELYSNFLRKMGIGIVPSSEQMSDLQSPFPCSKHLASSL
jgi:hypothetical protein